MNGLIFMLNAKTQCLLIQIPLLENMQIILRIYHIIWKIWHNKKSNRFNMEYLEQIV